MNVIGVCGPTGSGKDTVADYWAGTSGVRYKHSDVLRTMLERNGRPVVPARMSALFEAVAAQLGYAWIAVETRNRILADPRVTMGDGVCVVNGIRNVEEVECYRVAFGEEFRLLALTAPQTLRYERVRNRGERKNEHGMSWEEFLAIESLEAHTGEAAVMRMADIEILNDRSLAELYELLDIFTHVPR